MEEENLIICNSNDIYNSSWNSIYVNGRVPSPRHAHACAVVGDFMYLYGGYAKGVHLDDFFKFDLKLNQWIRILKNEKKKITSTSITSANAANTSGTPVNINPNINIISARHSHTMVSYGNCIYIFGGIGVASNANENVFNDLFEYNTITNQWRLIPHSNDSNSYIPEKRWGHSAVVYKDSMVVFGGMGQSVSFYPTILVFDFKNEKWSRIHIDNTILSQVPRGRQFHTSSIINDELYIIGGYDGAVIPNGMHKFDLIKNCWSIVPSPSEKQHLTVRCATSITYNNKIYLFGGRNREVSNSIHEYDPLTNKWTKLNLFFNNPTPRQYSSSVLYKNNMIIFGGQSDYNENDIYSYTFDKNIDNSKSPFKELFENKDNLFTDIKFKIEDKIICAHKSILASRNEKMRALITNGMKESSMEIIEINDCSYDVFSTLIQYFYTNNLIFKNLNILELLIISDQYMINEIKFQCSKYISKLKLNYPISEIYLEIINQSLSENK